MKGLLVFLAIYSSLCVGVLSSAPYSSLDDLISQESLGQKTDLFIEEDEASRVSGQKKPEKQNSEPDEKKLEGRSLEPKDGKQGDIEPKLDDEKSEKPQRSLWSAFKLDGESTEGGEEKDVEKKKGKALSFSKEDLERGGVRDLVALPLPYLLLGVSLAMFVALYIYWKKIRAQQGAANVGMNVSVVGQKFIDAGTKVVLLKVGSKVLVLAKSAQFCTTLDVISDIEEVNLLTLGAGVSPGEKDFKEVLKGMEGTSLKTEQEKAESSELRKELDELKSRLSNFRR